MVDAFNHRTREDRQMTDSELYRKGAALRRKLYGDAAVERTNREVYSDPVMRKFFDAATGREPELAIHLRFALRQGWTEDELTEVLLHLSGYVGVPMIREAMLVAKRVFAEIRAEGGA